MNILRTYFKKSQQYTRGEMTTFQQIVWVLLMEALTGVAFLLLFLFGK